MIRGLFTLLTIICIVAYRLDGSESRTLEFVMVLFGGCAIGAMIEEIAERFDL